MRSVSSMKFVPQKGPENAPLNSYTHHVSILNGSEDNRNQLIRKWRFQIRVIFCEKMKCVPIIKYEKKVSNLIMCKKMVKITHKKVILACENRMAIGHSLRLKTRIVF